MKSRSAFFYPFVRSYSSLRDRPSSLAACRTAALEAAEVLGWTRIECVQNGQLRSVEAIHEEIWGEIQPQI